MLDLAKPDLPAAVAAPPRLQRARGSAHVAFKARAGLSVLDALYQFGCSKVRLPRAHEGLREAVLINTAGGLTDGDELTFSAHWGAGTSAVVTTQACERIYRSRAMPARIATEITADNDALACWLPQETILFDGGRLRRTTKVRLCGNARLIACEAIIVGRAAMGESVHEGALFDEWRIERDNKLVYCDRIALEGDMQAQLGRPATGAGARAFATIIYAGADSARMCALLRARLHDGTAACSDLGDILLTRLLAPTGQELRRITMDALQTLLQHSSIPGSAGLPRVWMF